MPKKVVMSKYAIYLDEYDRLMRSVAVNEEIQSALEEVSTMDDTCCDPVVREAATAVLGESKYARFDMKAEKICTTIVAILGFIYFVCKLTNITKSNAGSALSGVGQSSPN